MKSGTSQMARRILAEKRRFLIPLAVLLLANVAVYAFVVYPMQARVNGAEERARAADLALRNAALQRATVQAVRTDKERAEAELKRFYADALPAGSPAAWQVLYLRVNQIARQAGVQYKREAFAEAKEQEKRQSRLQKLSVTVVLEGPYANIRTFIHALETAPEFVVVENVALATRGDANAPLVLTMVLSTYYRAEANGS
jgi:Tfp pilus assembly protein PilO